MSQKKSQEPQGIQIQRQEIQLQVTKELKMGSSQLNQNQIVELHHFYNRQQCVSQKFLHLLRLMQYQKPSEVIYPLLLPNYNNTFYVHLGPSDDLELEVVQEGLADLVNIAYNNITQQFKQNQQFQQQQILTSLISQKQFERSNYTDQNQFLQHKIKQEQQIVDLQRISQFGHKEFHQAQSYYQGELYQKQRNFTPTPYFAGMDFQNEKNKIKQRCLNRLQGNITKRIRKTKEQQKLELEQGKDPKETKNIPKNYAKAIMTYILKNDSLIDKFNQDPSFKHGFINFLQTMKIAIQNIKQFKAMLSDKETCLVQQEYNRIFRIISQYFIKNHAIAYIFNSRITQKSWHLKYRSDLLKAVQDPNVFSKVKPRKFQI